MKLKLGIRKLDDLLDGVEEKSLILIHEADARSMGKFLALEIMREKLDSDNLVGFFNIGNPLPVVLDVMNRVGLDWKKHMKEHRLVIIDTFGSIYETGLELENVWYLKKPIIIDTLNNKYLEVIKAHKEKWAQLGMFKGKELWGITISISDYLRIFNPKATQKYIEISDLQRSTSNVYKEYPAGTNVWVYSGTDTVVMPIVYRKADYVLRTESKIEDGDVRRFLTVVKAPGFAETPSLEYAIKNGRVVFD